VVFHLKDVVRSANEKLVVSVKKNLESLPVKTIGRSDEN
jgi:hypothetical protein